VSGCHVLTLFLFSKIKDFLLLNQHLCRNSHGVNQNSLRFDLLNGRTLQGKTTENGIGTSYVIPQGVIT